MTVSINLLCCILAWILIIGVPTILSIWLSQVQNRRAFAAHVRSLSGRILSENAQTVEVQLPSEVGIVSAAFFPKSMHWYGTRVLEMHFPIPATKVQLFLCGNEQIGRALPAGWQPAAIYLPGYPQLLSATATPAAATPFWNAGMVNSFRQLDKIHPRNCRLAIDDDQLVVLVSHFSNSAAELSSLLIFGAQLARQIEALQTGQITLVETAAAADSSLCPICSSPAVNPLPCSSCGAPHCRECWQYNEQLCGVFGCGGGPLAT